MNCCTNLFDGIKDADEKIPIKLCINDVYWYKQYSWPTKFRSLELRYDDTSFGNFRVFKGCMKEQYADFTFGLERILEFDALDEI